MQGPRLSGSTGCNSFTAALKEGADNNISIEDVTLTRKLCGVLEAGVENAFLSALADTQYLKREGARLTFLSGKQEALLVWTRGGKSARRGPARRSGAYRARWAPRAVAVSRWCGRR
jgi:heat shock protein HslJ